MIATEAAQNDQTRDSMNYAVDREDGGGMGFSIAAQRVMDTSDTIRPNQLIIVDEAGMVDTRNLQWVTRLAESCQSSQHDHCSMCIQLDVA